VPKDLGEDHSDIFERVIKVDSIEETELGDYPAVMVTDTAGNEYTSFKDTFREELIDEKEKYVDEVWEILFTVYKGEYLSFQGFTEEKAPHEAVEEEVDIEDFVDNPQISPTDRQITRQSAAHDASRVVEGMLAGGYFRKTSADREELREEIQEELEYWTGRFKQHHRTGDWSGE
jgi:hypothetical protein